MPADVAHHSAQRDQRRLSRKPTEDGHALGFGEGSHAREIELKRSRGEISCAECRRLKIKCDKQLPCSSCMRRGCASLCPNGSLATGQGTRFVLAATDHLHRRIAKMSERIRQLEDSLAILQSHVSQEPHPLLRDELLLLKVEKPDETLVDGEPPQEASDVIDAFGTLSIDDKGSSRFFGPAGGTEMLLLNEDEDGHGAPYAASADTADASPGSSMRGSRSPHISPEIALFSNAFPFTPIGPTRAVQAKIESLLPPWERASALCAAYLEQAWWLFRTITPVQLMDELLPDFYKRRPPPDTTHEHAGSGTGPHALALLLMVFAVGALVDLTLEPYNAEAAHYYQLAKAAITLQSVLGKPEPATIQTLHLMSVYNCMDQPDDREDDGETSMELAWSLVRQAHQLALTIGLHRDSARWGLEPLEVQRRRVLFWDLFVADAWQSLATGRPPSLTPPYIDCHYPQDDEAQINSKGETEPGFGCWLARFAGECVGQIAAKMLTAAVPPYSTVLDLDANVRSFALPESTKRLALDAAKPSAIMMHFAFSHFREIILLNLHRSFFAQAMIDDPVNPLRSQYAPSFLATYRSAAHILKTVREEFEILPDLCTRFWFTWTFAFSAAVVFGSIVIRGPSSSMAPSSLAELDSACELFSRASTHSKRASKALVILQRMQSKAHAAYESCLHSKASPNPVGDTQLLLTPKEEKEDELSIFSGRTRLLASKRGGSSTGSSPPYVQGAASSGHETPTPPLPPPPVVVPSNTGHNMSAIREVSATPTIPTPPETASGEGDTTRTDVAQAQIYDDLAYTPIRTTVPSMGWANAQTQAAPGYVDMFDERGSGTYASASGYASSVPSHEVTQHNMGGRADGAAMKYEWGTPDILADHHQHCHQNAPQAQAPYPHAPTYSNSSNSSRGMDRMEYGGPTGAVSRQYSSHAQQQQHDVGHSTGAAYSVYHPPPPLNTSLHIDPNYAPPATGVPHAHSLREMEEMGLASPTTSGVNQRWCTYMQDSGLFYGNGGPMS